MIKIEMAKMACKIDLLAFLRLYIRTKRIRMNEKAMNQPLVALIKIEIYVVKTTNIRRSTLIEHKAICNE